MVSVVRVLGESVKTYCILSCEGKTISAAVRQGGSETNQSFILLMYSRTVSVDAGAGSSGSSFRPNNLDPREFMMMASSALALNPYPWLRETRAWLEGYRTRVSPYQLGSSFGSGSGFLGVSRMSGAMWKNRHCRLMYQYRFHAV